MPKGTVKKDKLKKQPERYERVYKDFLYLALIVLVVWIFELPAVFGLISSAGMLYHGISMAAVSVIGFSLSVVLLAFDKRKATVITSIVSSLLVILICVLVYKRYGRALNTSEMNILQISTSYAITAVVPIADIIMVNRRI